jgi:hypothetical protein
VAEQVPESVAELLSATEVEALAERAAMLVAGGTFPVDPSGRRYPWPLV